MPGTLRVVGAARVARRSVATSDAILRQRRATVAPRHHHRAPVPPGFDAVVPIARVRPAAPGRRRPRRRRPRRERRSVGSTSASARRLLRAGDRVGARAPIAEAGVSEARTRRAAGRRVGQGDDGPPTPSRTAYHHLKDASARRPRLIFDANRHMLAGGARGDVPFISIIAGTTLDALAVDMRARRRRRRRRRRRVRQRERRATGSLERKG